MDLSTSESALLMMYTGTILQALEQTGQRHQRVKVPVPTADRIVLHLDGDYSRISASLCSHCPRGQAGCCTTPPSYWPSDIALLALAGQGDWLIEQVRKGKLAPRDGDTSELQLVSVDGVCTFWRSGTGCVLPAERRPPYCNHYICGEALSGLGIPEPRGNMLDPIRALRDYYYQRRSWLSYQIAATMMQQGEWPLRWDPPKRARKRLEVLAKVAKPLLAGCLAPKGIRVTYAAFDQEGSGHGR